MNQEINDQPIIDLGKIKTDIASVNDLPISSHSTECEKIHKQLQQRLTNLDGVSANPDPARGGVGQTRTSSISRKCS